MTSWAITRSQQYCLLVICLVIAATGHKFYSRGRFGCTWPSLSLQRNSCGLQAKLSKDGGQPVQDTIEGTFSNQRDVIKQCSKFEWRQPTRSEQCSEHEPGSTCLLQYHWCGQTCRERRVRIYYFLAHDSSYLFFLLMIFFPNFRERGWLMTLTILTIWIFEYLKRLRLPILYRMSQYEVYSIPMSHCDLVYCSTLAYFTLGSIQYYFIFSVLKSFKKFNPLRMPREEWPKLYLAILQCQ